MINMFSICHNLQKRFMVFVISLRSFIEVKKAKSELSLILTFLRLVEGLSGYDVCICLGIR